MRCASATARGGFEGALLFVRGVALLALRRRRDHANAHDQRSACAKGRKWIGRGRRWRDRRA
jgi:hypothetical protein